MSKFTRLSVYPHVKPSSLDQSSFFWTNFVNKLWHICLRSRKSLLALCAMAFVAGAAGSSLGNVAASRYMDRPPPVDSCLTSSIITSTIWSLSCPWSFSISSSSSTTCSFCWYRCLSLCQHSKLATSSLTSPPWLSSYLSLWSKKQLTILVDSKKTRHWITKSTSIWLTMVAGLWNHQRLSKLATSLKLTKMSASLQIAFCSILQKKMALFSSERTNLTERPIGNSEKPSQWPKRIQLRLDSMLSGTSLPTRQTTKFTTSKDSSALISMRTTMMQKSLCH